MQKKKPPFKILSIIFLAVAAVFIALAVFVGVKYNPTPQPLNKKVVRLEERDLSTEEKNTGEVKSVFDDFKVIKEGAAASGVTSAASGASGAAASGAASGAAEEDAGASGASSGASE